MKITVHLLAYSPEQPFEVFFYYSLQSQESTFTLLFCRVVNDLQHVCTRCQNGENIFPSLACFLLIIMRNKWRKR